MVFSSSVFLFAFLPLMLYSYYLVNCFHKTKLLNIVLICFSLIFYAWGGVNYLVILLIEIFVNYILTLLMNKFERIKLLLFILLLALDVGNLLYFKYFNFFVENVKHISNFFGGCAFQNYSTIILPIGISFYTFQILSYVIDVYQGKIKIQRNYFNLVLYVIMFPQLIAGPIVRYCDINQEIENRNITISDIEIGVKRFIIGLAKKVFIANSVGGMADVVFSGEAGNNTLYAWLGAICYTLQIFYDFSAYSDMAIGLGLMLGFHFNENFDYPYKSISIQEFWRRWHISLSTWFRDYVYIPLGGNRKGKTRTYLNLFTVFLLTGFWHGAAWQFIIWGLFHGCFLIIERLGFRKILERLPNFIRHIYVFFVVVVGWVFFRADNMRMALQYIKNMFSFNFVGGAQYNIISKLTSVFIICFITGIFLSVIDLTEIKVLKKSKIWNNEVFVYLRYLVLFLLSILYLVGISYNPFIYFKF